MRDPILDRGNAYLAALRRACGAARRAAEGLSDAEPIVSGLTGWCRNVLFDTDWTERRSERGGLSDLLTLPPDQAPLRVLECVTDGERRESLGEAFVELMEGRDGELRDVLCWLFGKALAKGLVDELPASKTSAGALLSEARHLIGSQQVVHSAFVESLRKGLDDSCPARRAIRSTLESWVDDINADPGVGTFSIDRSSFDTLVDEWRKAPSIAALWKAPEAPFPVHYERLEVLPSILPTDRIALLERLDGFRFPHPIRQVLGHSVFLHDREEIAEALRAAPPCSKDGRSWNGCLLALLLLETVESHSRALWEAVQDGDDADSTALEQARVTLSSWFEELGRIVMGRPDGPFLGSQWLFRKIADERRERARRRNLEDRFDHLLREANLIEWIARGLSGAGLAGEQVSTLVDLPETSTCEVPAPARPASRNDDPAGHHLAALSVMCLFGRLSGRASRGDERKLLNRLDALLASRDSDFESEFHMSGGDPGLPASCFGYLLAKQEHPAERWRKSWDLLVEQRRRVQHWSQNRDGDALAPSVFLLAVGLAGIDWLLSLSTTRREAARRLWEETFDGARDCWLTIPLQHLREEAEGCVRRLFARHPLVFRDPPGEANASAPDATNDTEDYLGRLGRDLDLLGGDDLMLAACLLNARRNGASAAAVGDVLRRNSGHLDAVLRQFEQWQRLERRARRRPEMVEAVSRLRAEAAGSPNDRRDTG